MKRLYFGGTPLVWCRSYTCRVVHLEQVFKVKTEPMFKIFLGQFAEGPGCACFGEPGLRLF